MTVCVYVCTLTCVSYFCLLKETGSSNTLIAISTTRSYLLNYIFLKKKKGSLEKYLIPDLGQLKASLDLLLY